MLEGLPVAGYTPQPQERVALVNENKRLEEIVLRALDKLEGHTEKDWLEIARYHIELGFMCANRAIFQPNRINLPGDTP